MQDFSDARIRMVRHQLAGRGITDAGILDVYSRVQRHIFVKESYRQNAYSDFPIPISDGQTISQPYMSALMTQSLELKPWERVLEIGTGSGYQSAILSQLVKEVYTIERYGKLANYAEGILRELNYTNIHIKTGDGTLGWQEFAPYDKIIVTAGAPYIPKPLKKQLKDKGCLVIPIGSKIKQMLIAVKRSGRRFIKTNICACVFVPLIGKYGWNDV